MSPSTGALCCGCCLIVTIIVVVIAVMHRYDYPAACLAEIGLALAPVMPTTETVMDVPAAQFEGPDARAEACWTRTMQVSKDVQPDPTGSRHLGSKAGSMPHSCENMRLSVCLVQGSWHRCPLHGRSGSQG